jgi:hypothetical protein
LPVFAFDPATGAIAPDVGKPIDLDIEIYFNRRDADAVQDLLDWMATKRHFNIAKNVGRGMQGGIKGDDVVGLTETLYWGGAVLWLLSPGSAVLADSFHDRSSGLLDHFYRDFRDDPYTDFLERRFPDLVDDPPAPRDIDPHQFVESVFARLDPNYPEQNPYAGDPRYVDLLRSREPDSRFNWNCVDDLIINLYAALIAVRP